MEKLLRQSKILDSKEIDIKVDLRRAQVYGKRPKEEVLIWMDDLNRFRSHLKSLINSLRDEEIARHMCFCFCCCFWLFCDEDFPHRIRQLTNLADRLLERSKFPNGVLSNKLDSLLEVPQFVAAPTLVGDYIQVILDEIWEGLMDPLVGIIGIHGIGGVGKTAALMNINNRLVANKTFDKIIWVSLSKDSSLEKLQYDIAMQLNVFLSTHDNGFKSAAMLLQTLQKMENFLIILDDMWEPISLKDIGIPLPSTMEGCKILLTTRKRDICQQMKTDRDINVEVLSEVEAWDLFVNKVGAKLLTPDIELIAREMVSECDSLPIHIISLGQAMRGEVKIEVWTQALRDLKWLIKVRGSEEKNLTLSRFSYSRLKNDEVRSCFLYCALFPEDYLFEPEELIRYWIGEGFIQTDGDILTQMDEGHEILRQLKDASMFETFMKKGHEWLKMHDLCRDSAVNILKEQPGTLVKAGLALHQTPYFWEWADSKKVSLIRNNLDTLEVDDLVYNCPNLTTLLLQDNPLSNISDSYFYRMPALQLLDLSRSGIAKLPPSVLTLHNLRALFLQHCTLLNEIPSVECLRALSILSLRGTSISELPQGIRYLVNLRFLDLSETRRLKHIEAGAISSLSRLEELHMQGCLFFTRVSPIISNCIKELKHLTKLAILTLSSVGFEDQLDTILYLQELNLKSPKNFGNHIFSLPMGGVAGVLRKLLQALFGSYYRLNY